MRPPGQAVQLRREAPTLKVPNGQGVAVPGPCMYATPGMVMQSSGATAVSVSVVSSSPHGARGEGPPVQELPRPHGSHVELAAEAPGGTAYPGAQAGGVRDVWSGKELSTELSMGEHGAALPATNEVCDVSLTTRARI